MIGLEANGPSPWNQRGKTKDYSPVLMFLDIYLLVVYGMCCVLIWNENWQGEIALEKVSGEQLGCLDKPPILFPCQSSFLWVHEATQMGMAEGGKHVL